MDDLKTVRAAFVQKMEMLGAREKRIEEELRQAPEPDSQERAVEEENAEVLQKLDQTITAEIQLLRNAIRRIDSGTYGKCTKCGKAISEARLVALPHTPTCAQCA